VATAIATLFSVILLIQELRYSLKIHTHDLMVVDDTHQRYDASHRLPMSFDIYFPSIVCDSIAVSAVDKKGAAQQGTSFILYRTDLGSTGEPVGKTERIHNLGDTLMAHHLTSVDAEELKNEYMNLLESSKEASEECGDCMGAAPADKCCNSCDDVRAMYDLAGWTFKPEEVPQCQKEAEASKNGSQTPVGCRVHGIIELTEGEGNVHFAPGLSGEEMSPKQLVAKAFQKYDTSHRFDTLRFGEHVPGTEYPMEGQRRDVIDTFAQHSYFVQVVRTEYVPLSGKTLTSNRYSVTELTKHLQPGVHQAVPGVFINYEVSPLSALVREERLGILSFLTSVCAVIGGVYVIVGMADGLFGSLTKSHDV
jgi:hypothetical protein